MTLEQQIAEILDAFRREIADRINERTSALAGDISRASASALEHDAQARESVLTTARADFAVKLDEALATARADAMRDRSAAISAVHAEADERIRTAVADATREAEASALHTAERELVESRARERHAELACLDRLADAVRRFDQARTLTDVLDALGEVVSREAPRVAMFLVRAGRLAGWRASGFAHGFDARSVEVPNEPGSLLWAAVARGEAVGTGASRSSEQFATPFGVLPDDAAGLAVPVRVGGEVVAVVYADDAGDGPREVPSAWPEVIEVLARHAARCLEVVTLSRAAAAVSTASASPHPSRPMGQPDRPAGTPRAEDDDSARRYARLLVSEIKLYHESAVTEGRQEHDLTERLRSEIDHARRLYEERVPVDIRSRTDHFDQELVRTLANGDPALLGPDRP